MLLWRAWKWSFEKAGPIDFGCETKQTRWWKEKNPAKTSRNWMSAHKRQFSKEVFAPFSPRVSKRLLSKENQESNSISSPSITNQLIKECLKSDVTTDCWTYLLASESAPNFLKKTFDHEQGLFLQKHDEAQLLWLCHGRYCFRVCVVCLLWEKLSSKLHKKRYSGTIPM